MLHGLCRMLILQPQWLSITIHFPPLLLLPTSGICLVLITGRYIFNTRTIFNSSFNQLCISVILQYFSPMNYFFPFQKKKTVPSRKTAFDILQIILLICYMYMYMYILQRYVSSKLYNFNKVKFNKALICYHGNIFHFFTLQTNNFYNSF